MHVGDWESALGHYDRSIELKPYCIAFTSGYRPQDLNAVIEYCKNEIYMEQD